MNNDLHRLEELFQELIDLPSDEARSNFLDDACGCNSELRQRLQELLYSHQQAGSFLLDETETHDVSPSPTQQTIGPYKLRELIGEGGMGSVYVAEQEKPLRRKVALKVIKPGMDSKAVLGRFEAERNALALMNHPNIAKVLDAGQTEQGHPYFVMELVNGIPITEYCDQQKLTIRERLNLFIDVCQAIQHAHQKGIIHRDIKPSNVLVTELDGKPIAKVIDFGVAKALNQSLTEHSVYTAFQTVIGTPLYMSPEQASFSAVDVDTRSDVYSLGVLLYELLTGTTPFSRDDLNQAAQDELFRMIRENDPPRPSNRISTLGETATRVSQCRRTEPDKLGRSVRGDLDWIVMKALSKERSRRYDSASRFGDDINRFLNDDVIEARPPSISYRAKKFYQRNRTLTCASSAVVLALSSALVIALTSKNRVQGALQRLASAHYETVVSAAMAGDSSKALSAIELARDSGVSETKVEVVKALIALNEGHHDAAINLLANVNVDPAVTSRSDRIAVHSLLASAYCSAGFDDKIAPAIASLNRLTPETDMDHLFMAYANVAVDPELTIEIIDGHQNVSATPVGLFLRAHASILIGIDRQDAEQIEESLNAFECVQVLFRDHPSSLGYRLFATTVAIELARSEGRFEDAANLKEQGVKLAKAIETSERSPNLEYALWMYYQAAGESDLASRAIGRVGSHPGTYSFFLAADLLENHDYEDALQLFDERISTNVRASKYVELARSHLLAGTRDGDQRMSDLAANFIYDPSPLVRRWALMARCLVCSRDEVGREAEEGLKRFESNPDYPVIALWGDRACVEFLAKRIEATELIERTGREGPAGAATFFTIAMANIAKGDREEAIRNFRLCVETQKLGTFDVSWARAYLKRMDKASNGTSAGGEPSQ